MSRILFTTHDPGAARMLACAFEPMIERGHEVNFWAMGPAKDIWGGSRLRCQPELTDIMVTGTGTTTHDSDLWPKYRSFGKPVVAAVDSPLNIRRRFPICMPEQRPTKILVPDAESAAGLPFFLPCIPKIVGLPHVEQGARKIASSRSPGFKSRPLIAYFSEPISIDYPERKIDQFATLRAIERSMAGIPHDLVVCAHPRENKWGKIRWNKSPYELAAACDLAIGINSTILVECFMARVPTISVQLGENGGVNPLIEKSGMSILRETDNLPIVARLAMRGHHPEPSEWLRAITASATLRMVNAIEASIP